MLKTEICPGCGAELLAVDGPVHRYMESSPSCWAAYGEVLAREYGNSAYMAAHTLTVDAYAVQHPGRPSPQSLQSVAGHLLSLCAVLEQGLSHRAATRLLGRSTDEMPFAWLEPPANRGTLSVVDVLNASTAEAHVAAVSRWAASVWDAWSPHASTVRAWLALVRKDA